jgi:hypothetical protein
MVICLLCLWIDGVLVSIGLGAEKYNDKVLVNFHAFVE